MSNGQTSDRNSERNGLIGRRRPSLLGLTRAAISASLVLQISAGAPALAKHGPIVEPSTCCAASTQRTERSGAARRTPDHVADYQGGIAARLRRPDGLAVPGRLCLLLAATGSDAPARFYDEQPYTHGRGTRADTIESNELARTAVEAITGAEIEPVEFTSAPPAGSRAD